MCGPCHCLLFALPLKSLPCFRSLTGVECRQSVISSHSTPPLGVGEATWDEWWRGLAFSHISPSDMLQYAKSCQHCGSSSDLTHMLKVSTAPQLIFFSAFGFPIWPPPLT